MLNYQPLEIIHVPKPVSRIDYIVEVCRKKRVLDLGCWDETALSKIETPFWLHSRIGLVARNLIGIDNSLSIPLEGIGLNNSMIFRGDITDKFVISGFDVDVIVAGELIEHIPNTLDFFNNFKSLYPGKRLLCTTPNATNITNVILGIFSRESTHRDHLSIYSYKTLATLAEQAGFTEYKIVPYFVRYTEMILRETGVRKYLVQFTEKIINIVEFITPMLAGGYILDITI